ncbi:MAG: HAMP domain-containing protein [Candidatus Gribaldobacteria bacterium]|nr:HAMP domain-containing protein [Candidatus Gribaldobacteria bacterium]
MKTLKWKIVTYILPLLVFVSLAFFGFFLNHYQENLNQKLEQKGQVLANSLSYLCQVGLNSANEDLCFSQIDKFLKDSEVVGVGLYNQDGQVIEVKNEIDLSQKMPEEILRKMKKDFKGIVLGGAGSDNKKAKSFWQPILANNQALTGSASSSSEILMGFARVDLSLNDLQRAIKEIIYFAIFLIILEFIIGLWLITKLSRKITIPLQEIVRGAKIFSQGQLNWRINITTKDELGILGLTLNQMAIQLQKSQAELKEQNSILDIKVTAKDKSLNGLVNRVEDQSKNKVKELEDKIKELEKFHRLTIKRELKMIALKKELAILAKKPKKGLKK